MSVYFMKWSGRGLGISGARESGEVGAGSLRGGPRRVRRLNPSELNIEGTRNLKAVPRDPGF